MASEARHGPARTENQPDLRLVARFEELVARLSVRPVVVVLLVLILVLGACGALFAATGQPPGMDLDGETQLPAFAAGLVLLLAGLVGLLNWRHRERGWPWLGLGLLFMVMSLDEVASIHERLESATDVDWQLLYAPVFLFAGASFLAAVLRLGRSTSAGLLVLGAGAWVIAQFLEWVQWGGGGTEPVDFYARAMVVEEVLEIAGSSLFLVALLLAFQTSSSSPAGQWYECHDEVGSPAADSTAVSAPV